MLQAKAENICIASGSMTGVYFQFGQDIAQATVTAGLETLVKELVGSTFQARGTNSNPTSLPAQ